MSLVYRNLNLSLHIIGVALYRICMSHRSNRTPGTALSQPVELPVVALYLAAVMYLWFCWDGVHSTQFLLQGSSLRRARDYRICGH